MFKLLKGSVLLAAAYGGGSELYKTYNEKDLKGKVVVITGAGSGIGRLMSLKLAKEGCKIAVWDVVPAGAEETVKQIKEAGGQASPYICDVSNVEAVMAGAKKTLDDFGKVDILINNAGIVSGKKILDVSEKMAKLTMDINTTAHFWTVRGFLPDMLERNSGTVVTIASAAGLTGVAGLADYCASKFGAVGFNESLRFELRKLNKNVSTLCVCPYYINTGMFTGVKTKYPFLLPILEPEYVANKIIKAIKRQDTMLFMPRIVRFTPVARVFPTWLSDRVAEELGISNTMDDFKGRH
eukprot:NODE_4979_length_1086_cov_22.620976_g4426_i0.p1 GENE.NODE_4979_length_1086_cov_22.620976_g4426_i0~~NODE_4979_length_1086_cov_22.620976_g4426_i0.p1  ORF type:complete len:309 (+),score=46.78 NODE_4979_length_1086_cov_22.620976_g4426_i0:41-928(+)